MGFSEEYQQSCHIVYRDISQKVAEAIESVLKIDVTIMDSNMLRIAGTGRYREKINERIEKKTAFEKCLLSGKPQIIAEEEKSSPVCLDCPKRLVCFEKAEICVPILYKDKPVGVIGIIAFNDEQKQKIISNQEAYLNFIQKMASLLEAKYSEIQMGKENQKLSVRLISILNTIDEGLIVYDGRGDVLYRNAALDRLFKEMNVKDQDEFIQKIWREIRTRTATANDDPDGGPNEILIHHDGECFAFLASVTALKENDTENEFIITLQNLKRLQKKVIQSAERNQISFSFSDIIGRSSAFVETRRIAEKAAESDSNVLIYGESGTGKELFARAIHNSSKRREYPFVPINCGAIPDELLESELFGYEKGAFTGAYNTKIGKFEVAENGTIFLDEISEMPYPLQVKLLRVLQEKEICRIGSNRIRRVNVRIISATNSDLTKKIKDGLFRADLYYRLNIIPIHIPPLRERKEDILFLTEFFIDYYNRVFGKNITGVSKETARLFLEYQWPGNVRELQNILEYAVNFETGREINEGLVRKRLNLDGDRSGKAEFKYHCDGRSLEERLKKLEKLIIEEKLDSYRHLEGKYLVNKVCEDLGVSRATFYRKVKEFGISLKNDTVS